MKAVGVFVQALHRLIVCPTDETAAFHYHIDFRRHKKFHPSQIGVDVYLLVFADDGITKVKTQAAAKSVEFGTVKRLAVIGVLVGAVMHRTADALAVIAKRHRVLQPLAAVVAETAYYELYTNI